MKTKTIKQKRFISIFLTVSLIISIVVSYAFPGYAADTANNKQIEQTVKTNGLKVKVTYPEKTFSEEVSLFAEPVEEEDFSGKDEETQSFDIGFINKDTGEEIEPDETVIVDFELDRSFIPEDVDVDSLEIRHKIEDSEGNALKTETVAKALEPSKEQGKVKVDDKLVKAEFKTDSFSLFTVVWKNKTLIHEQVDLNFNCTDIDDNKIAKDVHWEGDETADWTLPQVYYLYPKRLEKYNRYTGQTLSKNRMDLFQDVEHYYFVDAEIVLADDNKDKVCSMYWGPIQGWSYIGPDKDPGTNKNWKKIGKATKDNCPKGVNLRYCKVPVIKYVSTEGREIAEPTMQNRKDLKWQMAERKPISLDGPNGKSFAENPILNLNKVNEKLSYKTTYVADEEYNPRVAEKPFDQWIKEHGKKITGMEYKEDKEGRFNYIGETDRTYEQTDMIYAVYNYKGEDGENVHSGASINPKKSIKKNDDGTYTIEVGLPSKAGSEEQKNKLDIVFVVDTSGSMLYPIGKIQNGFTDKQNGYYNYQTGKFAHEAEDKDSRIKKVRSSVAYMTEQLGSKDTHVDANYSIVTFDNSAKIQKIAGTNKCWTNSRDELNKTMDNLLVGGATNYQAGLRKTDEVFSQPGARADARNVVIFLSDGDPTYAVNSIGQDVGNGRDYHPWIMEQSQRHLKTMGIMDYFYTIGVGPKDEWSKLELLQKDANGIYVPEGTWHRDNYMPYDGTSPEQLNEAMTAIYGDIITITARDVVLKDTLADSVTLADDNSFKIQIKNEKGEIVNQGDWGKDEIALHSDPTKRLKVIKTEKTDEELATIRMEFPKDYEYIPKLEYQLLIKVKPTAAAYGEQNDIGDPGTGEISAGKKGVFTNGSDSKVAYNNGYQDTSAKLPKPVISLTAKNLKISNIVSGKMGDPDKKFSYKVSFKKGDKPLAKEDVELLNTGLDIAEDGTASFKLTGGKSKEMRLPVGVGYTVSQQSEKEDGYFTKVNGKSSLSNTGLLNEDAKVEFVNTKDPQAPTGNFTHNYPLIILTVLAIGIAVLAMWRKKPFENR